MEHMQRLLAIIVTNVFFFLSCTKNIEDKQIANSRGDSLFIIKTDFNEKDTLQDIIKDAETGLDYFFYGKRNSDSKIKAFTSLIVRNRLSPDTTLNILFDENARIKTYYTSVKGINDTSLYTIGYFGTEDSLSVCRYLINWTNGDLILRKQAKLKKAGSAYNIIGIYPYGLKGVPLSDKEAIKEYLAKTAIIGTSVILIIGGGLAGTGICGPLCGLLASIGITYILFGDISTANASELPPGVPLNINGQQIFVTTTSDILQSHSWKFESKFFNNVSDFDPCEADDILNFDRSGVFTRDDNIIRCGPGGPEMFPWSLYNNDQSLLFGDLNQPASGYLDFVISKLSFTRLELVGRDEFGNSLKLVLK